MVRSYTIVTANFVNCTRRKSRAANVRNGRFSDSVSDRGAKKNCALRRRLEEFSSGRVYADRR